MRYRLRYRLWTGFLLQVGASGALDALPLRLMQAGVPLVAGNGDLSRISAICGTDTMVGKTKLSNR